MRLSDLRVEHAVAPIGIDPAAPLFSFLADAEGTFTAELVAADGKTVALLLPRDLRRDGCANPI